MLRKISSEKDIDEYINHFDKLDKKEKESELDYWEGKISGNYNNYELLLFYRILNSLGIDTSGPNDLNIISAIEKSKDELLSIIDILLDGYQGTDRQKDLLDRVNKSLDECDLMSKCVKI